MTPPKAFELAWQIDHQGSAIVFQGDIKQANDIGNKLATGGLRIEGSSLNFPSAHSYFFFYFFFAIRGFFAEPSFFNLGCFPTDFFLGRVDFFDEAFLVVDFAVTFDGFLEAILDFPLSPFLSLVAETETFNVLSLFF